VSSTDTCLNGVDVVLEEGHLVSAPGVVLTLPPDAGDVTTLASSTGSGAGASDGNDAQYSDLPVIAIVSQSSAAGASIAVIAGAAAGGAALCCCVLVLIACLVVARRRTETARASVSQAQLSPVLAGSLPTLLNTTPTLAGYVSSHGIQQQQQQPSETAQSPYQDFLVSVRVCVFVDCGSRCAECTWQQSVVGELVSRTKCAATATTAIDALAVPTISSEFGVTVQLVRAQ
jgi:hypothetical protein